MLRGVPLLGNLREVMRDPIATYTRGYRELGSVFQLRVPGQRFVVMAGPEALRVLQRHERGLFSMKNVYRGFDELFLARNSLTTADGDVHVELRKRFRPTMSRTVIEKRLDRVVEVTRARIEHARGRETDAVLFCRDLVFHQLAMIMDMEGERPEDFYDDIVRTVHTAMEIGLTRRWPRFMRHDPRFLRARRRTFELSARVLDKARGRDTPSNLLGMLDRCVEDGYFEQGDMPMLTLLPFIAGLDTVASTMSFFIAAVYRDPELMKRLRQEVKAASAEHAPGRAWIDAMPLLESVKTESMRRYPAVVASIRECIAPFELNGSQLVPGDLVIFSLSTQNLMQEYYPDPLRFDPERFLAPEGQKREPAIFTPFGVGAHVCLGAALAEVQLSATLATLLEDPAVCLLDPSRPVQVKHDPFPIPYGDRVCA